ncbi:unnamed protein product [Peniophora sp. CBMAI 1063]|nr:unnamed protein product [Peniophora sp. CBMAI 1063]
MAGPAPDTATPVSTTSQLPCCPARGKPKPYDRKNRAGPKPATSHKTSAKSPTNKADKREALTLGDWLDVLDYIDKNPGATQPKVVAHFATRLEGALLFDQSLLSRNALVKGRARLATRLEATANARDTRRAHIVMCPDVEHALWLWHQSMEARGKTPSGAMLVAK